MGVVGMTYDIDDFAIKWTLRSVGFLGCTLKTAGLRECSFLAQLGSRIGVRVRLSLTVV